MKEDIELGMSAVAAPEDVLAAMNQIEGAILAEDHHLLAGVNWVILEPMARRGVQTRVERGEITPGVAVSLNERITKFSHAIVELKKR